MSEQIASHRDKNKMQSSMFDITVIEAITMLCPLCLSLWPAVAMAPPAVRCLSGLTNPCTSLFFFSHLCCPFSFKCLYHIIIINHMCNYYNCSNLIIIWRHSPLGCFILLHFYSFLFFSLCYWRHWRIAMNSHTHVHASIHDSSYRV